MNVSRNRGVTVPPRLGKRLGSVLSLESGQSVEGGRSERVVVLRGGKEEELVFGRRRRQGKTRNRSGKSDDRAEDTKIDEHIPQPLAFNDEGSREQKD